MKIRVHITLKPGVLDPQGQAVQRTLARLGFAGVTGVRIGKVVELEVAEGTPRAALEDMCKQLLANPVMEDFRIE